MNTKIYYEYRDAGNYHTDNYVVVEGEFTEEGVERILETLWDGESFVPEMIGFPVTRGLDGEWDEELDHIYCDLDDSCFTLTDEEPFSVQDMHKPYLWRPITWDETIARFEMGEEEG